MNAPAFGKPVKAPWLVLRAFHADVALVVPAGQPDEVATAPPVQAVPAVAANGLTKPTPGTLMIPPKLVTTPAPFSTWFPEFWPAAKPPPRSSLPSGPGLP